MYTSFSFLGESLLFNNEELYADLRLPNHYCSPNITYESFPGFTGVKYPIIDTNTITTHYGLPDNYTFGPYTSFSLKTVYNDDGIENVTALTIDMPHDSSAVIGDNTFNSLQTLSFDLGNHPALSIGNNSCNAVSVTNIMPDNTDFFQIRIGDNSCKNVNLSARNNTYFVFGNNSLRTLQLPQDGDIYFSSGNFGSDLTITPITIPSLDRTYMNGNVVSMISASFVARGGKIAANGNLIRTTNQPYIINYTGSYGHTLKVICPDCNDSEINWLQYNSNVFMTDNYGIVFEKGN